MKHKTYNGTYQLYVVIPQPGNGCFQVLLGCQDVLGLPLKVDLLEGCRTQLPFKLAYFLPLLS